MVFGAFALEERAAGNFKPRETSGRGSPDPLENLPAE